MRISSRCFIFKDDKIVLIYRENQGEIYYVFPGGKVEDGETNEQCVVREVKEELGLDVTVDKYVYEVHGEGFVQHFFKVNWVSGELGTGDKEEYSRDRKGGLQVPMLVDISKLSELDIVSPPIKKQLLEDIATFGLELDNNKKVIIEN